MTAASRIPGPPRTVSAWRATIGSGRSGSSSLPAHRTHTSTRRRYSPPAIAASCVGCTPGSGKGSAAMSGASTCFACGTGGWPRSSPTSKDDHEASNDGALDRCRDPNRRRRLANSPALRSHGNLCTARPDPQTDEPVAASARPRAPEAAGRRLCRLHGRRHRGRSSGADREGGMVQGRVRVGRSVARACPRHSAPRLNGIMSKVKIGILGSRFQADCIAGAVKAMPEEGEVVAVASPTQGDAAAFAQRHGVPRAYGDYRELLRDPDIEMISIAAPNRMHAQITIDAAKAGKHVVCEKPLCLTIEEADAMIDACRQAGVLLLYAEELFFAPKYVKAKQLADEGAFGRVHLVK